MAVKLAAAFRPMAEEPTPRLAARAAALGFRGAAIPFDPRWTDPDLLAVREAFDRGRVDIVELTCHCNFLTPREDELRENVARLAAALRAGAILNCDHVVTHAGSRHPDPNQPYAPHPENWADRTWDILISRLWALLDEVEDTGVCLCFEPRPTTTLNTLDALAELTADATSLRVRIALDPVAVMTPEAASEGRRALAESFARLADTIALAHATDLEVIEAGDKPRLRPAPLGTGGLHYPTYLKLLDALRLDTPLVVPHQASDAARRQALEFLTDAARQAGVSPA